MSNADQQAVILSLALTSFLRPGWRYYLCEIAADLRPDGAQMFETFRVANDGTVPEQNSPFARSSP